MRARGDPDGRARDPDGTALARLPVILSAGGGDQIGLTRVHDHPGDEIVFVERGRALVTAGGVDLDGLGGTLFLFPRGTPHDQRNATATRTWYVVFRCRGRAFPRRPRVLSLLPEDPAARWFLDVCAMHARGDSPTATAALLLAVLERLAARDARAFADRALPRPVSRALRLCERETARDLTGAELAAAAAVTPRHLRALFRRHLGTTPGALHRRLRLDLAANLLRDPSLTVAAVAGLCGWHDADYFARLFRRRFGRGPRGWRAAARSIDADRGRTAST